jgi:hypothetical protein
MRRSGSRQAASGTNRPAASMRHAKRQAQLSIRRLEACQGVPIQVGAFLFPAAAANATTAAGDSTSLVSANATDIEGM